MNDSWSQVSPARAVTAVILVVLLLSGPGSGLDFTGERTSLGKGDATVRVVEPSTEAIPVTNGRFGTSVSYVRIPDLVVDVSAVEGNPRVFYQVVVPSLDIRKQNDEIIRSTGRLRVPIYDRAVPKGTTIEGAEARLIVRVQSFSGGQVVLNRTVEVTQDEG